MHFLQWVFISLIVMSAGKSTKKSSPYWEYILREFVFKTVSSPFKFNEILYKKVLAAPFYGGSLPPPSNLNNELLSRGDVYHLPDGSWILCQEGCNDCELCKHQKASIVKWTLRRMRRFISPESFRYDLQLTVVPQTTQSSHGNFGTGNYVFVRGKEDLSTEMMEQVGTTSSNRTNVDRRFARGLQKDQNGISRGESLSENSVADEKHSSTLKPNERVHIKDKPQHSLIIGVDQTGKSQLIHVLSVNQTQKIFGDDVFTYKDYVKEILVSLQNNRHLIEKFLSYPGTVKNVTKNVPKTLSNMNMTLDES